MQHVYTWTRTIFRRSVAWETVLVRLLVVEAAIDVAAGGVGNCKVWRGQVLTAVVRKKLERVGA